jgi:hypothetical protein
LWASKILARLQGQTGKWARIRPWSLKNKTRLYKTINNGCLTCQDKAEHYHRCFFGEKFKMCGPKRGALKINPKFILISMLYHKNNTKPAGPFLAPLVAMNSEEAFLSV